MQVWNMLHTARWKYRTQKWRQKSPSAHHRTTLSRCIFATKACISNWKKNLLNTNMSSSCPHTSELRPINGWDLLARLGHPSKFQRVSHLAFVTAVMTLTGGQPNFARCLPSPALLHYIYIFGGSFRWQNFAWCKVHFASKSCVLMYWQRYCTALQQRAWAKLCGVVHGMDLPNFDRGEGATYIWHDSHHVRHRPTL